MKEKIVRSKKQEVKTKKAVKIRQGLFATPALIFGFFLIFTVFAVAGAQKLSILVHDSFAISDELVAEFEAETGIELEFIAGGDAGQILNKAILTKKNPLADVLYGIDNSLLARAQLHDLFVEYESPNLSKVPLKYIFDQSHIVTPIDVGYVNFNFDLAYFEKNQLQLPKDILDLAKKEYRAKTVVEHPATSSPGLAFMLATIARFGESGDYNWLDYWYDLKNNDLLVQDGWTNAYYTAFSRYGGDRPIVLSYATSPAAEVIFADEKPESAPTANLFCQKCVYEQIEAVGILKGSKHIEEAQQFIDFMLSKSFQDDIPMNMFVYPVSKEAVIPEEFKLYSQKPLDAQIASLEPGLIQQKLRTWLRDWTAVVEQGRKP